MTVTELRRALQRLERAGHGRRELRVPEHTLRARDGESAPYATLAGIRRVENCGSLFLVGEDEPEWKTARDITRHPPRNSIRWTAERLGGAR